MSDGNVRVTTETSGAAGGQPGRGMSPPMSPGATAAPLCLPFPRDLIRFALRACAGNRSSASRFLGLPRDKLTALIADAILDQECAALQRAERLRKKN